MKLSEEEKIWVEQMELHLQCCDRMNKSLKCNIANIKQEIEIKEKLLIVGQRGRAMTYQTLKKFLKEKENAK